jgi:c-di-AMP phosphodiesterase-like protein
MAKENLEDLSSEQLKKRKKTASVFIGVFIGIIVLTIVVVVISIIIDKGRFDNIPSLVPGFILIFFLLYMLVARKNIDEELARRNDK